MGRRLFPMRGKAVGDMRRHDIACGAQDKSIGFKLLQGLRQHAFADPGDAAAQLGKAVRAGGKRDHDQRAPFAGQMLQDLARGTFGGQNIAAFPAGDHVMCLRGQGHVRLCGILTKM